MTLILYPIKTCLLPLSKVLHPSIGEYCWIMPDGKLLQSTVSFSLCLDWDPGLRQINALLGPAIGQPRQLGTGLWMTSPSFATKYGLARGYRALSAKTKEKKVSRRLSAPMETKVLISLSLCRECNQLFSHCSKHSSAGDFSDLTC